MQYMIPIDAPLLRWPAPIDCNLFWLGMAAFTFRNREGDLAVANTTFLTEYYRRHVDLVGAFARNENVGVAV